MATPSSTRSQSEKMQCYSQGICCHSISDFMEWFIILSMVIYAAISDTPFSNTSSISAIQFIGISFGPIYFFFMFNVLLLKITTYWQYQKEMSILREIEIAKNRHNKPNKLKALNNLINNRHSNPAIWHHFVTLTKSVLFAFSLSQLLTIGLQLSIASSAYISNSFPSKFAAVSISTNCLLFLCMMHSFRFIQSTFFEHKYNDTALEFTSIDSHCFNGNTYFGSNIWYVLRHIKILSIFIMTMPLLCSMYFALTHTVDIVNVMGGIAVAILSAVLSYNAFKDELLFEVTIPTLSVMMEMQSEEYESREVSAFESMSAGNKTYDDVVSKRSRFPELGLDADTFAFANAFGSYRNEYNIEDLEQIALHVGSNFISTKSVTSSESSRSIGTDMDGVDVCDDDDEIEIELLETDESMTTFDGIPDDATDTMTLTQGEETQCSTLYNHRKNMTLRLSNPSTKSTRLSVLSPLSMAYEKEQSHIVTPKELYFSNIRSVGTMATATTLSPLSAAAHGGGYQKFVE
eukprot:142628_1